MNLSRTGPFTPALAALLVAACGALAGCQPAAEDNVANQADSNEAGPNLPAVPLPQPPMDRDALLTAVARAASASAAGIDDTDAQRLLDGNQFELRIRFGCRGPAPELEQAVLGWTFDPEERILRLRAMPTISGGDAVVERIAGDRFEAVEGFWVPRPWMLDPVCPATATVVPDVRPGPLAEALARATRRPEQAASQPAPAARPVEDPQESEAPPPAWPKVGIAQFFTDTDPRTGRRDMRPYQTVKTLDRGQSPGSQGFNLVLSGRLQALPGQKVIACVARGPDNPPNCIVSADFDRVWMERPDTKEVLAEWGSG